VDTRTKPLRRRPPAIKASVRLNKFLADSGVTSRRKADQLIRAGAVELNGKTVYELGVQVDPERDRILVDGKLVKAVRQRFYIAFFKPESVLTTMSDPSGRPTVVDFMQGVPARVFPVGRLDWDTEGLLLLTNDGEFAQKISHPRTAIPKTYLAKLNGEPSKQQMEKLKRGVPIIGGRVSALAIERVSHGTSDRYPWVKIVITEGKNRQVRQMFQKIGFDVKKLRRVGIGQLELGHLRKGQYVFLGPLGIKEALATNWRKDHFSKRGKTR
jgi:23S rRNA pseudouridine2605 synthase